MKVEELRSRAGPKNSKLWTFSGGSRNRPLGGDLKAQSQQAHSVRGRGDRR